MYFLCKIKQQYIKYGKNSVIRNGDSIFINYNRAQAYDINELYGNLDSSEDIDDDYYKPLS